MYDLLGGATSEYLEPYLTSWSAESIERFGVRDVKIAMPYGPAAGEVGKRENERAVQNARETIGPDGWIALDCYMGWDVAYAVDMCRRLDGLADGLSADVREARSRRRTRLFLAVSGAVPVAADARVDALGMYPGRRTRPRRVLAVAAAIPLTSQL